MATPLTLPASSHAATKAALEALLRERKLRAEAPPLRGEDRRPRPLATGVPAVDALLLGGFPRGQLSEVFGHASSGRTGLVLSLLARVTRAGALAAHVDPLDRLDPASAAAAGVTLPRLLWLRGPRVEDGGPKALAEATTAAATLLGSGLFDAIVLDLAGIGDHERRRLPATTWIRLQRMAEETSAALVLVADGHVACGPGGRTLALAPTGPRWSGPPGPGRLLAGLGLRAVAGRALSSAELQLIAFA